MAPQAVAVVLLNYNGREDTLECLESLARATYRDLRVCVVDNGSRVSIRAEVEARFPRFTLLENGANLGFTGGNNVGLRRALADGAEFVLLLNNDTVVHPGFVEPLVEAMADPRVGMSTPKILFYEDRSMIWAYGARVDPWTSRSPHIGVYEEDRGQHDGVRRVDRITGCAMFVRRELLDRVGLLDDRFFIYEEELDWCLRAREAGYDLVVEPQSVIWHKGHRDSGRIGRPFMTYLRTRNHLLILRRHARWFRLGAAPALAYTAIVLARAWAAALWAWARTREDRFWRDARAVACGVGHGLVGRYGPPPSAFLAR